MDRLTNRHGGAGRAHWWGLSPRSSRIEPPLPYPPSALFSIESTGPGNHRQSYEPFIGPNVADLAGVPFPGYERII